MKKKLVLLTVILTSLFFNSCKKDDSSSPDTKQFIKFTYENSTYNWQGDGVNGVVTFFGLNNIYSINAGFDEGSLIIAKKGAFEVGKKYDIMSTYEADIQISLVLGENSIMSYFGDTNIKVGEVTITSDSNGIITGTFYCEMGQGTTSITHITNGTFSASKVL